MRRAALLLATCVCLLALCAGSLPDTQAQQALPTSAYGQSRSMRAARLGITFISSWDHPASEERYRNALLLGAGWNRWPLYWERVETAPGAFDWSGYDRLVNDDMRHGLRVNAILMGRPGFYTAGGSISGLQEPIFSDGTDLAGAGKTLNPANPWANFVYQAVLRYKPGGELAAQLGWSPGMGVTVWEMWNEPDLGMFWNGGTVDYARLLKVGYIVAHLADPNAQVMFGGLAYGNPDEDNWLARVLEIYQSDPLRDSYNWFIDIVGVHNYSYSRRSGLVVERVIRTMADFGINRPVWLNESGVPVWDDYPGPTWAAGDPEQRSLRVTAEQAAYFVVQSTAYAWAKGADVVFYHQLYDDCGNQPGGSDFPPHNGELCTGGAVCWGDAHGLYRNNRDNGCFEQHPFPGSPRPAASAFRLLSQVFGTAEFGSSEFHNLDVRATVISFERAATRERIWVLWNRGPETVTLRVPAGTRPVQLFGVDSSGTLYPDLTNEVELSLPAAEPDSHPYLPQNEFSGVGGEPYILIMDAADADAIDLATRAPITVTPGPLVMPRATTSPLDDITPPTVRVLSLPPTSPATFTVTWQGSDDGAIDHYLIWVRVNGGQWTPWLETARTEAIYVGVSGSTYEFAAWAVDLGGNWSENTSLSPEAITQIE